MHWQIPGRRHRRKVRKSRRVRVVAVHAVVAQPWPSAQIPVPVHAAVRSAVVIAKLRAMALRAELHRLGHRDARARREPQSVIVIRVVTAAALVGSVCKLHGDMRPTELLRALRKCKLLRAVAARTGHIERLSVGAAEVRLQPTKRGRRVDGHRVHRVGRDGCLRRIEPREVVACAALRCADKHKRESECVGLHWGRSRSGARSGDAVGSARAAKTLGLKARDGPTRRPPQIVRICSIPRQSSRTSACTLCARRAVRAPGAHSWRCDARQELNRHS